MRWEQSRSVHHGITRRFTSAENGKTRRQAPCCDAFIDNRTEVLIHLTSVRHRVLFGPQEVGVNAKRVMRAQTWTDIAAKWL